MNSPRREKSHSMNISNDHYKLTDLLLIAHRLIQFQLDQGSRKIGTFGLTDLATSFKNPQIGYVRGRLISLRKESTRLNLLFSPRARTISKSTKRPD